MRLTSSLSVLLVTLIGLLGESDAAPARRQPQLLTFPIRSLHGRKADNVPSHVFLQQHINRGERRLARMTGRQAPSELELRDRLEKRMYIIPADGKIDPTRVPGGRTQKRYNSANGQINAWRQKHSSQTATNDLEKRRKIKFHRHKGGKKSGANASLGRGGNALGAGALGAALGGALGGAIGGAAFGGGAAGALGGTGAVGGAAPATASTAVVATGTPAGNGTGVSPLDIQAALKGGLTQANAPTANNSLGLNIDSDDAGYVATVQIGTPPKNFNILMDSGSADLWVGSETCQSQGGGGCGNHQFLGPQSSSSFVQSQQPFQVTYGTGEVQGVLVKDNINLAGLQLPAHVFGVANVESVDFSSDTTDFDGLMGLAKSTLSQQQTLTPVESLAQAGLIPKAVTSYKISRLADAKNDGEITFGGLDPTKFVNNTLVTLPNVNQQGFWEANLDTVTVDGKDLGLQGRTAILDTGTTLLIAPTNDAIAIHQQIQGAKSDGQGGFTVPCTLSQSVALTFGGNSFAIDPRDIAFLPVDPNNPTGDCQSGISAGQIGGANEWLVGDVFLKNAYFSTDVNDNTVSLAKLA